MWRVLKNIKTDLLQEPAASLSGRNPEEVSKSAYYRDSHTSMLIDVHNSPCVGQSVAHMASGILFHYKNTVKNNDIHKKREL